MSDFSEELTVILTIVWWLRKLECVSVTKQTTRKFDLEVFNLK